MKSLRTTHLDQLLRHELGHISTLLGQETRVRHTPNFWLIEGLAEYIANQQEPFSAYGNRYWAAQFIRNQWNGALRVTAPTTKSSSRDAAGRYGTAFLAVTCLAQTYGQNKLLNFFQATAVQGEPLTDTAARELGVPWTTANRTCATKIRQTAQQG